MFTNKHLRAFLNQGSDLGVAQGFHKIFIKTHILKSESCEPSNFGHFFYF